MKRNLNIHYKNITKTLQKHYKNITKTLQKHYKYITNTNTIRNLKQILLILHLSKTKTNQNGLPTVEVCTQFGVRISHRALGHGVQPFRGGCKACCRRM